MEILEIKKKLKELSKNTGRSYNDLALELAMETLILRLMKNDYLSNNLVFKGGFVIYKSLESQRFTRDVDSLSLSHDISKLKNNIEKVITKKTNDRFIFYDLTYEDLLHVEDYEGLRCSFRFNISDTLKDIRKGQKLHLDIGFGDYLACKSISVDFNSLITNDLQTWKIYPLESIVAEKLEALVKRGELSSRAKDIYDLSLLLPIIENFKLLNKAITGTFTRRKTELPNNFHNAISKIDTSILKTAWGSIDLIGENVDFDKTWKLFLKQLKKSKL